MSSIAGFFHSNQNFQEHPRLYRPCLEKMNDVQKHRGSADSSIYLDVHCGLAFNQSVSGDPSPYFCRKNGRLYAVMLDGILYNSDELKHDLSSWNWMFDRGSDAELFLKSFLQYGFDFASRLNGVFSAVILDFSQRECYLYRDFFGTKPLFYTISKDGTLVFSSEIKGLFCYPGITPKLSSDGLNEIFSLGPARTPGNGVFDGVFEVPPAHCLIAAPEGPYQKPYWRLSCHPHEDDDKTTIEKISFLFQDAVERQMKGTAPFCTFLSGGVDSSLVSAICAKILQKKGERLTTFSFDFSENSRYFQSNAFQPSLDRPYVDQMVSFLDSDHHYLECSQETLAEKLTDSVIAHDLPAMADVDSSMLYFCSLVRQTHTIAMTGECADEIFGGYPWFHKTECLYTDTFPWSMDLRPRQALLRDDFLESLHMEAYIKHAYESSVAQAPLSPDDSDLIVRQKRIAWLNISWFMQTLLNRMDRAAAYSDLDARIPFADRRLVEYLFQIPWEMKAKGGVVKRLLREAGRGMIPDEILFRKKSPYPKTYHPQYEQLLKKKIKEILSDSSSPILSFIDPSKVNTFLSSPSDYGRPWYGQLMAGPQMLAYLIQINEWLTLMKL